MGARILVLEDDRLFNETICDSLSQKGYTVEGVHDPYSALEMCYQNRYDLYLFDINLPFENGFEILQKLRQSGDETYAIYITSREDLASLQKGFKVGADDYIQKPFALEELVCRIEALLRRKLRNRQLKIGNYTIDADTLRAYRGDRVLDLNPKAVRLLLLLYQERGRAVTFDRIKHHLWASAQEASDGSIRVYIAQLKKYWPGLIQNLRGIGYQMER